MRFGKFIAFVAAALTAVSCDFFAGVIHDGKVVARVGNDKLYSTDLEKYIPSGLAPEDSVRLAMQFINSWASDRLFLAVAEKELSKQELDVTDELEDYRRSLIKYRYEQAYVNQRLDTVITQGQIEEYFAAHKNLFVLRTPLLKVRFMSFSKDSPALPEVRRLLALKRPAALVEVDSLARSASLRYTDFGGGWTDAVTVAMEFGTDYMTMVSMAKDGCIEMDGDADVRMALISDKVDAGQVGPEEYYVDKIKDILLSTRKQQLLSSLETDLVARARADDSFVIY